MILKEMLEKETLWYRKAIIIETYHLMRVLHFKKWTIEDTAKELQLSEGFVCKELKLAKILKNNEWMEKISRAEALREIKNGDNE